MQIGRFNLISTNPLEFLGKQRGDRRKISPLLLSNWEINFLTTADSFKDL